MPRWGQWTESYWVSRAEEVFRRLHPNEYQHFVVWLTNDPQMLKVYERSLDECLEQWNAYQGLRLPEGL